MSFAQTPPATRPLTPNHGTGHERIDSNLHSGVLHCELETLTLLSLKQHFADLKRGDRAWLPGSSIKGMVRNVAEMIGAGCTLYFKYKKTREKNFTEPRTPIRPCSAGNACLVCRVFGYAPPGEEGGWQGKARFHDSESVIGVRWEESPGGGSGRLQFHDARHTAFYGTTLNPAGWKIYPHGRNETRAQQGFISTCVPKSTKFSFRVAYENLDEEEFAVLRFALSLQHQCAQHLEVRLCHKLGYGKGLGLGSCRVNITKIEPENPRRYLGESKVLASSPSPECLLAPYLLSPGFDMVKECLNWETAADRLEFPSQDWFADNSDKSIKYFEDEKNQQAAPAAVATPAHRMVIPQGGASQATPKGLPLNKRVLVRVTEKKGNRAICETVEEFEGARYVGSFESGYMIAKGDTYSVKVESVDNAKHTFKARQPKVTE
ncbi:MAG: hypothetical protein LAO20_22885 [Acidobacteriia bacterium]|nr:hypothetical protein [Terriglobia bacterium]